MIVLALAAATATVAGSTTIQPGELRLDLAGAPGCVHPDQLRAALGDIEAQGVEATVVLRETSPGRLTLFLTLDRGDRSAQRSFELRRQDCALVPRLVARVYARYAADLPRPSGSTTSSIPRHYGDLAPTWPDRRWVWLEGGTSPGLGGGPRVGARTGLARGPSGALGWAAEAGYDLVPDQPVGAGRAWLHALWVGAGASWEGAPWGVPMLGVVVVGGGVALAEGRGFDDDRLAVLPVGRIRLEGRIRLSSSSRSLAPHVGATFEGGPFDLRLSASGGGSSYREPMVRAELLIGVSWASTVWGAAR